MNLFSQTFLRNVPLLLITAALLCGNITLKADDNSVGRVITHDVRSRTPFFIPKCDSPKKVLVSFYFLTSAIKDVFEEKSTGVDIDWDQEKELITLYSKLTYLLDTSELPEKDRFARTHIICSELSEILDRIPIPPLDSIPDYKTAKAEKLNLWRVPDTEISIELIKEGTRKGDWVFSADTVKKADEFYLSTKHLPFKKDATVGLINNETGILDRYIDYTGPIIPVNFTNHIPNWMRVKFFDLPLWKYFATLIILLILFFIGWFLHKFTHFKSDRQKDKNPILFSIRRLILPAAFMILLPVTINLITVDIRLRLLPLEVIDDILWSAFYLISIWFTIDLGNLVAAIIIKSSSLTSSGAHAGFIKLCSRVISYSIGLWILFAGLKDLGLSLVPLIAGVNVGGLAFALAAKPSLANLLWSVLIFAGKPFLVGERVVIGNHKGTVEDIGLRSTVIRTMDGHHVSIPNDEVCNSSIENIARRPNIRRKFGLTITYDTPAEKILRAIEITKQILSIDEDEGKSDKELGRPGNRHINSDNNFPPRVYFDKLNDCSLNLQVNYWFSPPVYWSYLEHATWVNTELIKRFSEEGIEFAFPTQTLDVKQPFAVSMDTK
ncbi:MAG: hypothetical protein DRI44_03445 [Chlamydiae bacterium]|nr:MAG: hypothetical protein DRI44_03445 [Chlamydiota bacterium]